MRRVVSPPPRRLLWLLLPLLAAAGLCEGHLPRPWEDVEAGAPGGLQAASALGVCAAIALASAWAGARGWRPLWVAPLAGLGSNRPARVGALVALLLAVAAAVPVGALGLEEGCQPAFPGSVGLLAAVVGVVAWWAAVGAERGAGRWVSALGGLLLLTSLVYFAVVVGLLPAAPISERFPGFYYSQSACQVGPVALGLVESGRRRGGVHRGALGGLLASTAVAMALSLGGSIDWPTSRALEAIACALSAWLGLAAWAATGTPRAR